MNEDLQNEREHEHERATAENGPAYFYSLLNVKCEFITGK